MLLLRCTHKVLKLFNQRPRQAELCAPDTGLGDWYVNLAARRRRGFFVFVNAKSLYTLLVDARSATSIGGLVDRMLERLFLHLDDVVADEKVLAKVANEYRQVLIAKTASRSVLGSMNDLINHLCWNMDQQMLENGSVDIGDIEARLNAIPQRPIGWCLAVERLTELVSAL